MRGAYLMAGNGAIVSSHAKERFASPISRRGALQKRQGNTDKLKFLGANYVELFFRLNANLSVRMLRNTWNLNSKVRRSMGQDKDVMLVRMGKMRNDGYAVISDCSWWKLDSCLSSTHQDI